MSIINLRPDDLNIQGLKATNNTPAAPRAVTAVEPYPTVHPANVRGEATQPSPPVKTRDRRARKDRRRKDQPVLLDTRSPHDRRKQVVDPAEDSEEESLPRSGGVDVYI